MATLWPGPCEISCRNPARFPRLGSWNLRRPPAKCTFRLRRTSAPFGRHIHLITRASFVCSVLQEVSQPVLLRSYPSPGVASQLDCKIWEACRATSAATSFFDPISIGPFGQQFSDGATGWNNPVRQVYTEARRLWPDSKIQCLVSIGTGKPRLSAFGDGLREVAKTLVRMATETELTAEEFLLDHADLGLTKAYFRFNVLQGLEEVGLQEYSAVPTIASATMAYLESQEASEQVKQCVLQLRAELSEGIIEGKHGLPPPFPRYLKIMNVK